MHDNAPAHTAYDVREFLDRKNIDILVLSHPAYSPDLAPCDFWLFKDLKRPLRGRRFSNNNELWNAADTAMQYLQKNGLLFVFEKWIFRMQKCIELEGYYIEKQ